MTTQIAAVVGFSCLLTFILILYQPSHGPGLSQRLGWQSWDVITMDNSQKPAISSTTTAPTHLEDGTDWWNVSSPIEKVDYASLPLDTWAPLLPHDTGLSEIALTKCLIDPARSGKICYPDTTPEQDALKGTWVRVERNLNLEAGYFGGFMNLYYRRTRRLDIKLITDIRLLPQAEEPSPRDEWTRVPLDLRYGLRGSPPLYMWYRLSQTGGQMSAQDKANLITELDIVYGDGTPWYGFERLEPATMVAKPPRIEDTWLTFRRGVKVAPKAPPLHFSRSGKFKILQVADLHFSVSQGVCRDTPLPCSNSDNLTSSLLMRVLDAEKPDLVVFSGDQLNGQETSWDPKSVLAKFARAVTDRKIPWAAVFGNHDSEIGASREDQMALLKALPYSLVERGPKDVHGVGNYVLKVKSADASMSHLLTLYFLDSGDYSKGFWNFWGIFTPTAYDYIHQNQIDWFLQESSTINPIQRPFHPDTGKDFGNIWNRQGQVTPAAKLAKPNALMFFHIPLQEAYGKADNDPRTGRPLDVGLREDVQKGAAETNGGFFEKGLLKAYESERDNGQHIPEVKVVANGHSHLTENCRRLQGIWSCFGGGGSFSGYGKVGFDRRFRIYDISDYGETIRTYKRTEHDKVIDEMILSGKGAPALH